MISRNSYTIPEWKNSPRNMGNRLHSVCSYMAMFPPSIPNFFIQKYSEPRDIILDPFSGRGTAPLEACMLGRVGIGNDKNPLAYVLTAAKVNVPPINGIRKRIRDLSLRYKDGETPATVDDWKIKMLYSEYTLRQISFLRDELSWNTNYIDTFITAMLLGIMHGNSSGYLSIKMPNTFSMTPNYVKKLFEKNQLEQPGKDR